MCLAALTSLSTHEIAGRAIGASKLRGALGVPLLPGGFSDRIRR
jgi:hypothetical protein